MRRWMPRCARSARWRSPARSRSGLAGRQTMARGDRRQGAAGFWDGEQRGDRPALDDLEAVIDQAPFDVLGTTEMLLDPPAEPHEPQDLRVRQRGLLLPLRLDRHVLRPATRHGVNGELLAGDRLGDDLAVAHLV